ncbi:SRPBCC family protein [Pseudonocardia spinosispora]|uniref:SRPBCC family protein n=1 Tax=Pseudonocardia spinosispora TaxID=103441 RepID=UPI00055D9F04|nr:SRPBCC family protein [Pseudonocardia spinosispora]
MELVNEFTVPSDTDHVWSLLGDVARIAPCLPGATVEPLDDGSYSGAVAVKVGPIKVHYRGTAAFRERDERALRMVLDAQGRETSGKGSAAAVISLTLHDTAPGDGTRVEIRTDLQVTGKVAQFGRSALNDVCARMIDVFAGNLETLLAADRAGTHVGTAPSAESAPAGELDVLALLGPLARRVVPPVLSFMAGALVSWLATRYRAVRTAAPPAALSGCAPSSASPP